MPSNYWWNYTRTKPRAVKGGIKAQSKRGTFGQSWWAKRWISVLESFDIGARLGRGRTYARKGQVMDVAIAKGKVTANVQGSSYHPYKVQVDVTRLSDQEWQKVVDTLAAQALFSARLLAGDMPQEIESAFQDAGVSLFPAKLRDLDTDCSCPDWSNPCKHIAAVFYLIGEEFDRDPFLIFTLRGKTRDEVMAMLGSAAAPTRRAEKPALPPEPLAATPDLFWGGEPTTIAPLDATPPPVRAALPRRLGGFPFWRGLRPFLETIDGVYERGSQRGVGVAAAIWRA